MLILAGAVIDSRNKVKCFALPLQQKILIILNLWCGQGGATALFVAAQEGYLHAVEFLLDNGAAVEAKDKVSAKHTYKSCI